MGKTKQAATYSVDKGQWLVILTRHDYPPVVLSVEGDERTALEWRAELVRRIVASPDAGYHALTESSGRIFVIAKPGALATRLTIGDSLTGTCEVVIVRAETPIPAAIREEDRLHRLLPGRFPAVA